MRVIFLDIDGVLNSAQYMHEDIDRWSLGWTDGHKYLQMDPAAVKVLEAVYLATGAVLVISSTWRICCDLKEIETCLRKRGCHAEVVGITTTCSFDENGKRMYRGDQIQDWLSGIEQTMPRGYDTVESFVILDDDSDMEHLTPHLVQTDFKTGLTTEHFQQIVDKLGAI